MVGFCVGFSENDENTREGEDETCRLYERQRSPFKKKWAPMATIKGPY
jgi:hypothetical protein